MKISFLILMILNILYPSIINEKKGTEFIKVINIKISIFHNNSRIKVIILINIYKVKLDVSIERLN